VASLRLCGGSWHPLMLIPNFFQPLRKLAFSNGLEINAFGDSSTALAALAAKSMNKTGIDFLLICSVCQLGP